MIYNARKDREGAKLNMEERRKVRNIWADEKMMTETVLWIKTDIWDAEDGELCSASLVSIRCRDGRS